MIWLGRSTIIEQSGRLAILPSDGADVDIVPGITCPAGYIARSIGIHPWVTVVPIAFLPF